jgi:hypothetical protein
VTTRHEEEDTRMGDPPAAPETGDDTDAGADGGSTTGTPRWAKIFGIVALVVIVLFVVLLLVGGPHGPGRHMDGGTGGPTPPADVAQHEEQ